MSKIINLVASPGGGAAYSPIWIADHHRDPVNIAIGCVVSGTVTYTVQYTYDDPNAVASPTWFPMAALTAQTANADAALTMPVAAIRVNATAGTGSVLCHIIQAGIRGA